MIRAEHEENYTLYYNLFTIMYCVLDNTIRIVQMQLLS